MPEVHCSGPSAGTGPKRGSGRDSMPSIETGRPPRWVSHTTAFSASRSPAQRSSGSRSASATARITARMSNGFLRPGLVVLGEDLADRAPGRSRARSAGTSETSRSLGSSVGARRGKRSPGRDVGALVVGEQHLAGAGEVGRPVLRLPVRAHHALVAADAEVVLGRHAARVVQRLLAGEHHRAVGRHHEDALGVHEHRRLGVPVRLRADVDAADDDVDLAAGLGELHDPPQRRGHPVHVLRAGVHRDLRARGDGEPLDGDLELLGEVERGDHPPALGLGQRAERARRVAEQRDAQHPLRVALGAVADQPDDDAGLVRGRRPVDRDELAVVVEVVLDELAGRDRRAGLGALGREQLDDLGRVQRAAAAGGDDPLRALVERLQRAPSAGRRPRPRRRGRAGLKMRSTRSRSSPPSRMRTRSWTSSSPSPALIGAKRPMIALASSGANSIVGQAYSSRRFQCRRSRGRRRDWNERIASNAWRTIRSSSGSAVIRPVSSRTGVRSRTSASADEALVARVLARLRAEQVDVVGGRQPLELEVAQPPQVQPLGDHRVQAAERVVLGERRRPVRARSWRRRPPCRARGPARTPRARRPAAGRRRRRASRAAPRRRAARRGRRAPARPSGTVRACAASARSAAGSSSGSPSVAATWWRTPSCS